MSGKGLGIVPVVALVLACVAGGFWIHSQNLRQELHRDMQRLEQINEASIQRASATHGLPYLNPEEQAEYDALTQRVGRLRADGYR